MSESFVRNPESIRAPAVETGFTVFHELMARKIQEILLVANPYDAYILEEDGSLASRIINEYRGLNLSRPPRLNRAASGAEALARLDQQPFDLVLAMPNLKDMDPGRLGQAIRRQKPGLPVIQLAHDARGLVQDPEDPAGVGAGQTFVWSGDSDLLLAIVKNAEDRLNVEADTRSANVRVLILVEDSPLYRSFFLPLIYREVVRQTQSVLAESLNEEHRLLKMRARPKILVAENFEQAAAMYAKFKPYVFGVISDTRFPKCGRIDPGAGLAFLSQIKREVPHLPLLLISAEPENRGRADAIGVRFVDKNTERLDHEIRAFFLDYLGFGDFIFRTRDGTEVGRAANFRELERLLPRVPEEPIYYHACRNRFSNWFMARSEITLATALGRIPASDFSDVDALRRFLIQSIHDLRRDRQKGVVARFSPENFDPHVVDFAKIGNGSLGGKARGLAFFSRLLHRRSGFGDKFPGIRIAVPKTVVITTDGFDAFVAKNRLSWIASADLSDTEIAARFLSANLPDALVADLSAFLDRAAYPLSVRSSSLFEDAYHQPYAGLYKTYMIPNNHPVFEIRLNHLTTAVKLVYASTYFKDPAVFSRATAHRVRRDAMAVMIQELAGETHEDFFYPAISGVAQSWNYYPIGPMRPEDGIARIALGFGKAVVEGEVELRFSPRYPAVLPQFSLMEDILANAQTRFYALKVRGYDPALGFHQGTNLELRDLADAETEGPVQALSSTYIPEEHRIRDSAGATGPKVMTFAPVLKHARFPLARMVDELLGLGREGMGCDVEFEFCVTLASEKGPPDTFSVLQMRPMAAGEEHAEVHVGDGDRAAAFCYSSQCLGHGLNASMTDIVYVRPETFDPAETVAIAGQISRINGKLGKEGRKYLLSGPGRWGSADRWLGIPVRWRDIDQVGAMVEVRNDLLNADASRGSHFFQHITAEGIVYVVVDEAGGDLFDWAWLDGQIAAEETENLRHIRLSRPFVVKSDGRHGRCAILFPET